MQLPGSFDGAAALPPDSLPRAVRAAVAGMTGTTYLYDLAAGRDRAAELKQALPAGYRVLFAVKANAFPPLAARLAGTVDGFEVSSVAEAAMALDSCAAAGAPPRLTVSGPAKNPRLLADLLAAARGRGAPAGAVTVAAESILELHRLSAARTGDKIPVLLRVNPARTPVAIDRAVGLTMGGVPGPFGLPESDVPAAIDAVRALPGLRFAGFHTHAVSGNLDADLHAEYIRYCLDWAVRTAAAHRLPLRTVDVGGGLGFPFEGGPGFDLAAFGAGLAAVPVPAGVEVVLEPGRWLAAPIGWYAAEVVDVKHSYGETFVVVRGGINHFQLPTSWEIRHNFAVLPRSAGSAGSAGSAWPAGMPRPEARDALVTVAGELCTPEDVLARGVRVGHVRAGDVLVFPNAGAYGFEFAMPAFLGQPPAGRVALGDGG